MRNSSAAIFTMLLLYASAPHALQLLAEDDPPNNMLKQGRLVGIATEKLQEAFRRTGMAPNMALVPWARAYQSALTQPEHCAFSAARTAERELMFKWIGPVAETDWVLYMRADGDKPATLDNVRSENIGGYVQDVIAVWLADHGYRVDTATSDAANPRKLLLGRINYWASARPRAMVLLEKEDLVGQIVPALTFGHTDLYLACHRTTPDALVQKLNAALRKMKEDGTSTRIDTRYARWPAE